MEPDQTISDALNALSKARGYFSKAKEEGLILGNDNHIGDIGEYWVMRYFKGAGKFKHYAPKKNSPYDIELLDGTMVSVKTITEWSELGYGTQVKPLCGTKWSLLAGVYLDKNLKPKKISVVNINVLTTKEPFVSNAERRKKGAKSYPRFEWWTWLDEHVVYSGAIMTPINTNVSQNGDDKDDQSGD